MSVVFPPPEGADETTFHLAGCSRSSHANLTLFAISKVHLLEFNRPLPTFEFGVLGLLSTAKG